ncbi:16S rRNA (uracil(1498)-N(3))-methyltransferase [Ruania zhangjianzhongii]|uniref:16S rRNA (uracil(1498)-N(3))-methyltransferase n=1 Tax=Ruania zhangjianzhongii TaxID=2603206 RepID=UPI0011CB3FCA|nr:16S rRNA (uracil(1498)-N(3))-methyltransferase [Ruania zhangjianzhongii]
MSLPVFVTTPGDLDGVGVGDGYSLTGPEARHAAAVMRLRAGEQVQVVDGAGVRLTGVVSTVDGAARLDLDVTAVDREQAPGCRMVLVQALAKGGRDELAIEAGTEVGMDRAIPWQAARSVSRWRGPKAAKGVQRWRQVVLAATKQSRRAFLPEVGDLLDGEELLATAGSAVEQGSAVLVAHESADTPIGSCEIGADCPEVLVVVGPEGGLAETEVAGLRGAGAQVVRLGPHVLRTSTAGPIALALLAQRLGRG